MSTESADSLCDIQQYQAYQHHLNFTDTYKQLAWWVVYSKKYSKSDGRRISWRHLLFWCDKGIISEQAVCKILRERKKNSGILDLVPSKEVKDDFKALLEAVEEEMKERDAAVAAAAGDEEEVTSEEEQEEEEEEEEGLEDSAKKLPAQARAVQMNSVDFSALTAPQKQLAQLAKESMKRSAQGNVDWNYVTGNATGTLAELLAMHNIKAEDCPAALRQHCVPEDQRSLFSSYMNSLEDDSVNRVVIEYDPGALDRKLNASAAKRKRPVESPVEHGRPKSRHRHEDSSCKDAPTAQSLKRSRKKEMQ